MRHLRMPSSLHCVCTCGYMCVCACVYVCVLACVCMQARLHACTGTGEIVCASRKESASQDPCAQLQRQSSNCGRPVTVFQTEQRPIPICGNISALGLLFGSFPEGPGAHMHTVCDRQKMPLLKRIPHTHPLCTGHFCQPYAPLTCRWGRGVMGL